VKYNNLAVDLLLKSSEAKFRLLIETLPLDKSFIKIIQVPSSTSSFAHYWAFLKKEKKIECVKGKWERKIERAPS
jgi:hypothetical protein